MLMTSPFTSAEPGLVSIAVRPRLALASLVLTKIVTHPVKDEGAEMELAEIVSELIAICEASRQLTVR